MVRVRRTAFGSAALVLIGMIGMLGVAAPASAAEHGTTSTGHSTASQCEQRFTSATAVRAQPSTTAPVVGSGQVGTCVTVEGYAVGDQTSCEDGQTTRRWANITVGSLRGWVPDCSIA